jgi:hypothetical protein
VTPGAAAAPGTAADALAPLPAWLAVHTHFALTPHP